MTFIENLAVAWAAAQFLVIFGGMAAAAEYIVYDLVKAVADGLMGRGARLGHKPGAGFVTFMALTSITIGLMPIVRC